MYTKSIVTILGGYVLKICVKQNAFPKAALFLSYLVLAFAVAEKPSRRKTYKHLAFFSRLSLCYPSSKIALTFATIYSKHYGSRFAHLPAIPHLKSTLASAHLYSLYDLLLVGKPRPQHWQKSRWWHNNRHAHGRYLATHISLLRHQK